VPQSTYDSPERATTNLSLSEVAVPTGVNDRMVEDVNAKHGDAVRNPASAPRHPQSGGSPLDRVCTRMMLAACAGWRHEARKCPP
jgi:hypothetical protein